MAKSLASIMSQIERLQKEAAAIQSEVIDRIQKEIAKYGLTAEQLFSQSSPPRAAKEKATKAKPTKAKAVKPKAAKYADGTGNTWGGVGKRPAWLHQALAAGKALEDFRLVKPALAPAPKKAAAKKAPTKNATAEAKPKAAARKRATRAKSTPVAKKTRKSAAKPVQAASAAN